MLLEGGRCTEGDPAGVRPTTVAATTPSVLQLLLLSLSAIHSSVRLLPYYSTVGVQTNIHTMNTTGKIYCHYYCCKTNTKNEVGRGTSDMALA